MLLSHQFTTPKNIPLIDYTTPYTYIEQLSKLNVNERLDINRTDFRNGGQSIKYHANTFEIAFYDKLKDLKQAKFSEKRAEEKDNAIQLNLLDMLEKKEPFEVLRMEARLNRRQKIGQVFGKIGIDTELTFKNIFDQKTAQKVLLYYLSEIQTSCPPLLRYQEKGLKDFFTDLLTNNPRIKLSLALKMVGLKGLLDGVGVREFRGMTKRFGDSSWYRINREMKRLKTPQKKPDAFSVLQKALSDFEPLKLVDFKDQMLNDDKYS